MKKKGLFLATLIMMLTMLFGMSALAATTKVVTLTNNKTYTKNGGSYDDVTYYKIKVTKPGYITVSGYEFSSYSNNIYSLYVQLCNSKKKPLEEYKTLLYDSNGRKTYYGVKKGTYYVKVQGYNHCIKYSFTPVSEKSGSSKSKAVTIKKNNTKKGLLIAGESGTKSDWYKINVTRKQKLKLIFGARANDLVNFKIVPANSKLIIFGSTATQKNTTTTYTTKDAFPAGTYYIQVTRALNDKSTSGYYTIKWR